MAISQHFDMRLWVDGVDISGDVASIDTIATPRSVLSKQTITDEGVARMLGHIDSQVSFRTWFNDAASQQHVTLKNPGTGTGQVLAIVDNVIGGAAFAARVKRSDYQLSRGEDGELSFTIPLMNAVDHPDWCEVLVPRNTLAAGDTTTKDDDASSSAGLVAYLQVRSFGGTDVTVKIQDSPDDSVWSDLLTFTQITGAPGYERVTVTGSVDQYLHVNLSGTFSALGFTCVYRRGTAADIVAL
jgi:hypothetical protein